MLPSHLVQVPGQRPARVGQGPVVVHLGGVAGKVRSPAAVRLGRREINVLTGGGSSVVGPAGVHLLQPPERHVAAAACQVPNSLEVSRYRQPRQRCCCCWWRWCVGLCGSVCVSVEANRSDAPEVSAQQAARGRGCVVSDTNEARVRSSSRGAFTCRVSSGLHVL